MPKRRCCNESIPSNENRQKMKVHSILITATFMKLCAFSSSFSSPIIISVNKGASILLDYLLQ